MSKLALALLATTLLVHALAAPLGAGINEWTTSGPHGSSVMAFSPAPSAPSTLYAWDGIDWRLWRSDDRGGSWRVVPTDVRGWDVDWLAVDPRDPERLYTYLPADEGFSFSNDGGATWRPFSYSGTEVDSIVVDPANPDHLWAASETIRDDGVSVWRSTDGGQSWGAASRGLPRTGRGIGALVLSPDRAVLWASGQGVWRSHDGGQSWQSRGTGLPDGFWGKVTVDPTDGETLYAMDLDTELWKTTDGGTSWRRLPPFFGSAIDLVVDPTEPDKLYLLTINDVLRSEDGGESWTTVTGPFSLGNRLAADPSRPGTVYAAFRGGPEDGNNGGIVRSEDGGDTWRLVGLPLPSGVTLLPGHPGVVFATNDDGLFSSTDGGRSWSRHDVPGRVTSVAADPTDPDVIYASSPPIDSIDSRSIFKSTDGGDTWDLLGLNFEIFQVETDPVRADVVYARRGGGGAHRLFKSQNGGATWIELDTGGRVEAFQIVPTDPDVLYGFAFTRAGVSRSDDGGFSWHDVSGDLPREASASVIDLTIAGDAVYAVTREGFFRTDDGGASWRLVSAQLPGVACELEVDPADPNVYYAGTFDVPGVWRSDDGGASWRALGFGDSTDGSCGLAIDPAHPETLYAATGRGIHMLTREACVPDETTLCVDDRPGDRRFRVRMSFATDEGGGQAGDAVVTPLAPLGLEDGGVMAFFSPTNPEVLVKVLDGCAFNDHFWVFAAAATSVGTELVVEDTLGAKKKAWSSPDGVPAPTLTDSGAFASCGEVPPRVRRAKHTPAALPVVAVDVGGGCLPDEATLCLGDGRFRVRMAYDTVQGGGRRGDAAAIPLSPLGLADGGVMAFFGASNPEVLVKVLDGCEINGRFWVFAAAATNVGFELVVDDLVAGASRTYRNPDVHAAETITDVDAFATCPF